MKENIIQSLFLLFIAISGNYIAEIFPCQIQALFTDNMYAKHLLTYMILLFSIVLNSDTEDTTFKLFTYSIGLYILFVLMTKMDKYFFLGLICIITIIYVLGHHKKLMKDDEEKKNISKIINILEYIGITIFIVGFLLYYGEKRYEYGKDFTIETFILGKAVCKGNIGNLKTNYMRNISNIF
jgi:hypothetical protein